MNKTALCWICTININTTSLHNPHTHHPIKHMHVTLALSCHLRPNQSSIPRDTGPAWPLGYQLPFPGAHLSINPKGGGRRVKYYGHRLLTTTSLKQQFTTLTNLNYGQLSQSINGGICWKVFPAIHSYSLRFLWASLHTGLFFIPSMMNCLAQAMSSVDSPLATST